MRRLHRGEGDLAGEVDGLRAELRTLVEELAGPLREEAALADDALQEATEALLLDAVIHDRSWPAPSELGVPIESYLLGLGDLAGEVRRLVLAELSAGRLPAAEARLALLEELYHTLMRFDAPRAVVSLLPMQVVARALLERTRGEVTLARLLRQVGPRDDPGRERP